jgi:hypothetical protein
VLMVEYPHGQVRAVTHYGITAGDVDRTIRATAEALAETRGRQAPAREPAAVAR